VGELFTVEFSSSRAAEAFSTTFSAGLDSDPTIFILIDACLSKLSHLIGATK
jgi:hypothetical protein